MSRASIKQFTSGQSIIFTSSVDPAAATFDGLFDREAFDTEKLLHLGDVFSEQKIAGRSNGVVSDVCLRIRVVACDDETGWNDCAGLDPPLIVLGPRRCES